MRRVVVLTLAVLTVAAYPAVTIAGDDGALKCELTAQLRPQNEVPPTASQARGHTQIKIRLDNFVEHKTLINNKGREEFLAGHIHQGAAGVNGPVVVTLFSGPNSDRRIKDKGTTSAPINGAIADAICASPQNHYVNYHTTVYPGGAIRGQLAPAEDD